MMLFGAVQFGSDSNAALHNLQGAEPFRAGQSGSTDDAAVHDWCWMTFYISHVRGWMSNKLEVNQGSDNDYSYLTLDDKQSPEDYAKSLETQIRSYVQALTFEQVIRFALHQHSAPIRHLLNEAHRLRQDIRENRQNSIEFSTFLESVYQVHPARLRFRGPIYTYQASSGHQDRPA